MFLSCLFCPLSFSSLISLLSLPPLLSLSLCLLYMCEGMPGQTGKMDQHIQYFSTQQPTVIQLAGLDQLRPVCTLHCPTVESMECVVRG